MTAAILSGSVETPSLLTTMSQVVDLLFKQITLGWFQLEPSCPQFTDDSFEPVNMLLWCSTEDNNLIIIWNRGMREPLVYM